MKIEVFGPGCAKCKEAEEIVKNVVKETGASATVDKVSDIKQMMTMGIMSTPAVAIDGKVMLTGRVPTKDEVRGWLAGSKKTEINSGGCGCSCGGKC